MSWPKEVPSSTPIVFELLYRGKVHYKFTDLFEWESLTEKTLDHNIRNPKDIVEILDVLYYIYVDDNKNQRLYNHQSYKQKVLQHYKEQLYQQTSDF